MDKALFTHLDDAHEVCGSLLKLRSCWVAQNFSFEAVLEESLNSRNSRANLRGGWLKNLSVIFKGIDTFVARESYCGYFFCQNRHASILREISSNSLPWSQINDITHIIKINCIIINPIQSSLWNLTLKLQVKKSRLLKLLIIWKPCVNSLNKKSSKSISTLALTTMTVSHYLNPSRLFLS